MRLFAEPVVVFVKRRNKVLVSNGPTAAPQDGAGSYVGCVGDPTCSRRVALEFTVAILQGLHVLLILLAVSVVEQLIDLRVHVLVGEGSR